MKYIFRIELHIYDDETGEDKRDSATSISLSSYDRVSETYIRQSMATACQGMINIIQDL